MEPIYRITLELLQNRDFLNNFIYSNMNNNYYWSDDFSEEFYIQQAYDGFISTAFKQDETSILLPEIQFEYAVLHFDNIHISKKVKKILEKDHYIFKINHDLIKTAELISSSHKDSWLCDNYIKILQNLQNYNHGSIDFNILSVEVLDKYTNEIAAAEIGYRIGATYTSLSGFSRREKKYNNYGKLQMTLLSEYLKNNGYAFWNMGHASMQYKIDMGAAIYDRCDFLKIWTRYRDQTAMNYI